VIVLRKGQLHLDEHVHAHPVNLNVHFHLVVPDGVFVHADDRLAFAFHPVPTRADVLAILDRIVRRLADEARDDRVEEGVDIFAQVQADAAATWRLPQNGKPTVRGVERLRAWCVTSPSRSLYAGVVIADHDREALERLCRYGTRPAFAHERLAWTADGQIAYQLKRRDPTAALGWCCRRWRSCGGCAGSASGARSSAR
jgi:hypothetical protein